jgi:hypothetical protein
VYALFIAATFVWRFHDAAYGLVIVWAYAGIVVKEGASAYVPVIAAIGVVVVAVLVALSLIGRLPPARGPIRLGAAAS